MCHQKRQRQLCSSFLRNLCLEYFQKSSETTSVNKQSITHLLCPHTVKSLFITRKWASLLPHHKYIIFHFQNVKFQFLFSLEQAILYLSMVPAFNLPLQNSYSVQSLLLGYAKQSPSHDLPHKSVCMAYLYSACLFIKPLQSLRFFKFKAKTCSFHLRKLQHDERLICK